MDTDTRAVFNAMPLLADGSLGPNLCRQIHDSEYRRTAADIPIYTAALRQRGLSARDADLILTDQVGTGESFLALQCSEGPNMGVNRSFYSGVGHQWQAVTQKFGYVYLSGDGTVLGMRVTGWN